MTRHFPQIAHASGLDFFSLLQKRRSIRAYKPAQVPQEKVDAVISAGQHAPSGAHRHPWLCKAVSDGNTKHQIREKCEIADKEWHDQASKRLQNWLKAKHVTVEKRFLTDAPVLLAIFGNTHDPYWLESVWICVGYMMLAAVDQGLGTVTYTPGNKEFMNEILDVPKYYDAQAILPLGFPLIKPQKSAKKQTQLEHEALKEIDREKSFESKSADIMRSVNNL